MRINPRELRYKIKIQKPIDSFDEDNRPVPEWHTFLEPRAKVVNISGEELDIAEGIGVKIVKTFYIRFRKNIEIEEGDRILYKGKKYNIKYINNMEEQNRYLEIKTEYIA